MGLRQIPLAVFGLFIAAATTYVTIEIADAVGIGPTISGWLGAVAFVTVITLLGKLPTGS